MDRPFVEIYLRLGRDSQGGNVGDNEARGRCVYCGCLR